MPDIQLATLTKQLAIELDFPQTPEENKNGSYDLDFGEGLVISIGSLHPGFYFSAKLGACPAQHCEDFFSVLMMANLFGTGTGGGVIALNDEAKELTLSLALPYQMPYFHFKEHIEDFLNHVDLWQKKTADASNPSAQRSNHLG